MGSTLAAFYGVTDGALFSSLLMLTILAQMSINLSQDYQRAFVRSDIVSRNKQNAIKVKVSRQMLMLILSCFLVFTLTLIAVIHINLPGNLIAISMALMGCALLLMTIRVNTRTQSSSGPMPSIEGLFLHVVCIAILPITLSFYLHTAQLNTTIVMISLNAALLSCLSPFSQKLIANIQAEGSVSMESLPSSVSQILTIQTVILISTSIVSLMNIYFLDLPISTMIFIFALPSMAATIATVKHIPEVDIAQAQKTKITLAAFAYWVLFCAGLMF
ncbi:hypothetical protein [Thalassotalea crassostreae]|uniref:hypothetical protein n=1 Tax=Thalassotalea crassostreae TaxID=1763536 RepID=UPI000837D949|nr:hypothetical protein [Thalassotalea crassostreae]